MVIVRGPAHSLLGGFELSMAFQQWWFSGRASFWTSMVEAGTGKPGQVRLSEIHSFVRWNLDPLNPEANFAAQLRLPNVASTYFRMVGGCSGKTGFECICCLYQILCPLTGSFTANRRNQEREAREAFLHLVTISFWGAGKMERKPNRFNRSVTSLAGFAVVPNRFQSMFRMSTVINCN